MAKGLDLRVKGVGLRIWGLGFRLLGLLGYVGFSPLMGPVGIYRVKFA